MMTMEEIVKKLTAEFQDEMDDSKSYFEMAKSAEHMGNQEIAHGLFEISKDEFTHAKFIREVLIDNGITIPDASKVKWDETKERMMRFFR